MSLNDAENRKILQYLYTCFLVIQF